MYNVVHIPQRVGLAQRFRACINFRVRILGLTLEAHCVLRYRLGKGCSKLTRVLYCRRAAIGLQLYHMLMRAPRPKQTNHRHQVSSSTRSLRLDLLEYILIHVAVDLSPRLARVTTLRQAPAPAPIASRIFRFNVFYIYYCVVLEVENVTTRAN